MIYVYFKFLEYLRLWIGYFYEYLVLTIIDLVKEGSFIVEGRKGLMDIYFDI